MERVWDQKNNCCGCTACEHTCPTHAIEMKRDEEGFLYPEIRADLCVDCGSCQNVCPILHSEELKADQIPRVYGAKHREEAVLLESTSGGAFTALSDFVLNQCGVVYGVSFRRDWEKVGKKTDGMNLKQQESTENMERQAVLVNPEKQTDASKLEKSARLECFPLYVSHFRAETRKERNRFRFSKYVQSDLKSVFVQAEEDLKEGRLVLFTGTPCQNAGLKSFCTRKGGRVPETLILCDVVCHSVPSPQIWQEYVDTLERESGQREPVPLDRAQFRTKDTPWSRQSKSFRFSRQGENGVHTDDRYHRLLFQFQTVARPSCYSCPFCELHRPSDLTIADYWGMEKYLPQFTDGRGVSLILTNTPKGERLFEQMKDVMDWVERPPEECLAEQPRLRGPMAEPPDREAFWQAWKKGEMSFETI